MHPPLLGDKEILNISESETSKKKKNVIVPKKKNTGSRPIVFILFFFFSLKCFLISIVISFLSTRLFKCIFEFLSLTGFPAK